jgi:xylan 1,4-beta-xylosidase
VWNYHDDDVAAPAAEIELTVNQIPPAAARVLVHHYRIDQEHSNAYTEWKEMRSPQKPSAEQYEELVDAGQLAMLGSPTWVNAEGQKVKLKFQLPRQGTSLVQLSW